MKLSPNEFLPAPKPTSRGRIVSHGDPVRHSQKPEESFGLIEKVSPPPRLELFARGNRPGWDAWGNECESQPLRLTA